MTPTTRLAVLFLLLPIMALTGCNRHAAPNGHYISTRPDRLADGSRLHPYDASTRKKFDALLPTLTGTNYLLNDGVYWTWGNYGEAYLNSDLILIGLSNPVIRVATDLPTNRPAALCVLGTDYGKHHNITIRGVTVDGNYPGFVAAGNTAWTMNGIVLRGTGNFEIRDCVTTNLVANSMPIDSPEAFSYAVVVSSGATTLDCTNNLVAGNRATRVYGPHQTDGFLFGGIWPSTAQCSVIATNNLAENVSEGYNLDYATNCSLGLNVASNCVDGVYGDTGNISDTRIWSNTFYRCWNWIADNDNGGLVGRRENIQVIGNTGTISGSPHFVWGAFLMLRPNIVHSNWTIAYNSTPVETGAGGSQYSIYCHSLTNSIVVGNKFNSRLIWQVSGAGNRFGGNIDENRNPYRR